MAETALEHGDRVVATLRTASALTTLAARYPEQLFLFPLDVTDKDQNSAAFQAAWDKYGQIDVVYHGAGFISTGEVESTPPEVARNLFEVSPQLCRLNDMVNHLICSGGQFLGHRQCNTQGPGVFPPQGGRLLQMSSCTGIEGQHAGGFYSAT
jgi:NAD(P)-dependent dehydrogenase (short-subunit alcohol dehydrogenase family)